ncbi:glycosyltransferase [Xanthomarina spongicola]|uniref:Cellulose synthase/poly-beta-1,6-N-acetylglucosamine synthase-like glycosyltransferase n=1 Tax=Xanthomarina spongicola TaxID=570520 RepID=A0A316DMF3_9FLAO|nr:glycosyltransferase [Xanthomarina spongicola]PWK19211.1 cellulose synthase/poly-beta-1,6-N-acetylglucosamine synthase-like glycosyltransferase [Xanthomarina spongicola]
MIILDLLFYTFLAVVSVQVLYFTLIFGKFAFLKEKDVSNKNIPVSVIICAKNEAENLKKFLPSVINQEYPDFQIVLINDASYDDTLEVMEDFANKYNHIKIVNVVNNEAFWANKKYALTLGIKAAKHEYLLFTDADCQPVSKHWISKMSANFSNSKSIVLGYGAYFKIKNSFLNKLIRFETLLTALQYFSFAKNGMPYMGVGRNLAYKKQAFFNANGFMDHMYIRSGDDDLFINQIANKNNTEICISQDSFTESIPKTTYKDWIKQKRRHITTASYYKTKHKSLLAIFYMSQLLFWILAIVLLFTLFKWQFVLSLIVLRFIIQFILYGKASKKLNERDLVAYIPVLELFLIGMQLSIFISNLISKPKHWK